MTKEYIIQLDNFMQLMDNDDCEFVLVITYELYVSTNHANSNSYLPTDNDEIYKIHRRSGKGYMLII